MIRTTVARRPLRLSFVLAHMQPGGAEMAVLNWIRALPRAEVEPALVVRSRTGALLDRLPKDVRVDDLGGRRAAFSVPALRRVLSAQAPDAVYSATSAMNLAVLAARPRAAMLVSEHTSPGAYLAEAKLPGIRKSLLRRLYPRATVVLAPTEEIAHEMDVLLGGRVACRVLANPVLSGPAPARMPESGLIVSAGRLVPVKGMDVLIRAVAQMAPPVRLRLFGEGPERGGLEKLVADLGMTERVEFAGYSDQLGKEMARASCFALASRREGFGNVLIEALHCGLPVVASDLPGPRAILEAGRLGTLVPVGDPAALAAALGDALLIKPAAPPDMGRFTVEASTDALIREVQAATA